MENINQIREIIKLLQVRETWFCVNVLKRTKQYLHIRANHDKQGIKIESATVLDWIKNTRLHLKSLYGSGDLSLAGGVIGKCYKITIQMEKKIKKPK